MMARKLILGVLVILVVAGCAAPAQQAQLQATPAAGASAPTATRARGVRPTPTPEATATATVPPTVVPTATTLPSATPQPTATAVALANPQPSSKALSAPTGGALGTQLSLNSRKYPAPALLSPNDQATYHVSQPVVHFTWSGSDSSFMTFGQTPGCVSDATNFRRALESYQLIIHSLDAPRADIVQWTDNGTEFDLNLTTVPEGRYSWSVNTVTICESYVVGQRVATIQRSLVASASPTSPTRVITWVP